MSPQLWRQVQQLFDAALDLDSAQRAIFLETVRTEHPALSGVLVSLLAANAELDRAARRAEFKALCRR